MESSCPALALILLFPAVGVLLQLFFGRRMSRQTVSIIGPGVMFCAFAVALYACARLMMMPSGSALALRLWPWIEAGRFRVDVALRLDALSAVMVLVVSGVGAFIHLYSVGYMGDDPDYARYFTYMNLFAFAMLTLVLADNLLLMFIGWEGVGLCSYLLIAFWYSNREFAYNGRKAFVVNRIGDAGFILGILTLVAALGAHGVWTLTFAGMRSHAAIIGSGTAALAGLLLFAGATGKSAQIPLYVWLPDAMVGPTPVSALIHAATMVTAGVYMVARLSFLYVQSPPLMELVAVIGAVTAFFAATIAIVQPDIKRVLAYSTISQIGYMFLGLGVGAFASGIFHLMTHAFFKALLFLGAGSVIHALSGEQDMRRMGALRHELPVTWATMLVATLAICAVPGFSGYFSKDLILEAAATAGHPWLYLLALATAGLTSFYMFRLFFLTFHGKSRVDSSRRGHLHESPPVMTVPLVVLAFFSVVGGWVGLSKGALWGDAFGRFLAPAVIAFKPVAQPSMERLPLGTLAVVVSLAGIALAYVFYIGSPQLPGRIAEAAAALYQLLLRKYYVDELYDATISRPLFAFSNYGLGRAVDTYTIDGIVDATAVGVQRGGEAARRVETGNVQHYLLMYALGAAAVAAYYLYVIIR